MNRRKKLVEQTSVNIKKERQCKQNEMRFSFNDKWFASNYLVGNFDSQVRQQFGRFGGAICTSH